MLLNVKGIGKIQDAAIEMKSITVIAGENNTGKSTFGKALYCMFNAFYDTERSIHNERIQDIRRILRTGGLRRMTSNPLNNKTIDDILASQDIHKKIDDIITTILNNEYKLDDNIINMIHENIVHNNKNIIYV